MVELLYFSWNGVSSEKYKLYIENPNEGINLPSTPNFTDGVASPQLQNVSYYYGTSFSNTKIKLSLAAIEVTLLEYKGLLDWLKVDEVGELILDTNPNFHYSAKISSIGESIWRPFYNEENDTYILEFEIEFTTIGDYAKISNKLYKANLDEPSYKIASPEGLIYEEEILNPNYLNTVDPFYKLPIIIYDDKANSKKDPNNDTRVRTAKIINSMNDKLYIDAEIEGVTKAEVIIDNKTYYLYNFSNLEQYNQDQNAIAEMEKPVWKPVNLKCKGKYGFVLDNKTEELIEITVQNFIDRSVHYELLHPEVPAATITEDEIYNKGALIIPPSKREEFKLMLTPWKSNETNDFFLVYKFSSTDFIYNQNIKKSFNGENDFIRFIRIGDLAPLRIKDNFEISSSGEGKIKISQALFNTIYNLEEFKKNKSIKGYYILTSFTELMFKTSLTKQIGSDQSRFKLNRGDLKGFDDLKEKLYYDNEQNKWVIQRYWYKFSLKEYLTALLVHHNKKVVIHDSNAKWDYDYNQTGISSGATNSNEFITKARNFWENQELFNKYLVNVIDGQSEDYILFSIPLENFVNPNQIAYVFPKVALQGEEDETRRKISIGYSTSLPHLTIPEIESNNKEGFFITYPSSNNIPYLYIRLNKNRVKTPQDFISFIDSNNITIYYKMADTPTHNIEVLSQHDQDILEYADKKDSSIGFTDIIKNSRKPNALEPSFEYPWTYLDYNGEENKKFNSQPNNNLIFYLSMSSTKVEVSVRLRSRN